MKRSGIERDMLKRTNGRKIRILQLTTSTVGGPGRLVLDLANNLDKTRFEVAVAFGPGYPLDEVFLKAGIETFHVCMSRNIAPLINAKGFFQIYRLLKQGEFDIVHTHCSIAGFLGRIAAKLAGCPIIIFQDQGFAFTRGSLGIVKYIYLFIERLLEPITDQYVTVSNTLKQIGLRHKILRPNKVTVIYNGIDPRQIESSSADKVIKKKELGLDSSFTVVGIIGRLEPQKRVDIFLKGASMIRKSDMETQFLVVGDGPLRNKLEAVAEDLKIKDKVFFAGWKTDVFEMLDVIDVLCLTSSWEGMPLVVLEAMAMGKPVIATKVRGIEEVVEDGKTGILIPLEDPHALSEACMKLIRDKALISVMGGEARTRFEQLFTIERMIHEYESVYTNMINKKGLSLNSRKP
jgi:glycosyltransferase involved in cell wall biosynthesis